MVICLLGKKWVSSITHYGSIPSGPFLACSCATLICLVPVPNVMKQPELWMEEQTFRFMAVIPMLMGQILNIAINWSEFSFDKKVKSYLFSVGLGCSVYVTGVFGYYCLWTFGLGLSQPMAFGLYGAGTIACFGNSIGIWIW